MKIQTYSLGQMQTNCYIISQDQQCVIVDPGDSADFILEYLQRNRLELIAIVATHGHFDHVMAAGEIQLSFPVPFYIAKEDEFLIKRLKETATHFLKHPTPVIDPTNIRYNIEGLLTIGDFKFEIIKTPGHTPGSVCIYQKEEGIVFTGDTLFRHAIGDYTHKYSEKLELVRSVRKILSLPEETLIYPGHGEESIIQEEKSPKETSFN